MTEPKGKKSVSTIITIAILAIAYFVYNHYLTPAPNEYIVYYKNVNGLQASSPVMIRGARVGKIKSIDIAENGKLRVVVSLKKDIQLKEGTTALLASAGIISNKSINIINGKGLNVLPKGATLLSDLDTTTQETSAKITPYIVTAKYLLRSADSTLMSLHHLGSTGMFTNSIKSLSDVEKKMEGYSSLSEKFNHKGDSIAATIHSLNASTAKLSESSKTWHATTANLEKTTNNIHGKHLDQSLDTLNKNIKSISAAVAKIDNSKTNTGKLVNDKTTYTNASNTLDTANSNFKEMQKSPPGFSIFGKSKKKK